MIFCDEDLNYFIKQLKMSAPKVLLKYIILVFVCVHSSKCLTLINDKLLISSNDATENIASSIFDMIDKFYVQGHRQFDVRIYGKVTSSLSDVINKVESAKNYNFASRVEYYEEINITNCMFKRSSLIYVSNNDDLEKVMKLSNLINEVE